MSSAKETLASFEKLERKLPLAGDATISRGDITATEIVFINNDVVGPSPIVFEKANFFKDNIPSFFVGKVANGVVEKYESSSASWVDISPIPGTSDPSILLESLSERLIQEGDKIRWIPGDYGDMREAFSVIGWNDGDTVVHEAPNYSGDYNEEWPNWIPNQEIGYGQLNNLVVQLENETSPLGSEYDLGWLSSLPSGPKVSPTHFYPTYTINGTVPEGELKPLQNVVDLVPKGYIDSFGREVVIHRGIREAGTRVGIHIHEYGGYTLVLSGTITDYVENLPPATHSAGGWYYMPPNTPMSAANLGDEDAELIDIFFVPPGQPSITIIEPGWPSDEADGTHDDV